MHGHPELDSIYSFLSLTDFAGRCLVAHTATSGNTAANHAGLVLLLKANYPKLINPKLCISQEKQIEILSLIFCVF